MGLFLSFETTTAVSDLAFWGRGRFRSFSSFSSFDPLRGRNKSIELDLRGPGRFSETSFSFVSSSFMEGRRCNQKDESERWDDVLLCSDIALLVSSEGVSSFWLVHQRTEPERCGVGLVEVEVVLGVSSTGASSLRVIHHRPEPFLCTLMVSVALVSMLPVS